MVGLLVGVTVVAPARGRPLLDFTYEIIFQFRYTDIVDDSLAEEWGRTLWHCDDATMARGWSADVTTFLGRETIRAQLTDVHCCRAAGPCSARLGNSALASFIATPGPLLSNPPSRGSSFIDTPCYHFIICSWGFLSLTFSYSSIFFLINPKIINEMSINQPQEMNIAYCIEKNVNFEPCDDYFKVKYKLIDDRNGAKGIIIIIKVYKNRRHIIWRSLKIEKKYYSFN